MIDYRSNDVETAAHLAYEADPYPEPERPSPAELALDEAQHRRWQKAAAEKAAAELRASEHAGRAVRFTAKRLGLTSDPEAIPTRFVEPVALRGDEGIYERVHPSPNLRHEDWHIIRIEAGVKPFYCPCHRSHFEFIEDER